jgi:hypothetical protein
MANRKRRPIINFQSYSILEFIELVLLVIENMTGNIHFTNPKPTLASLNNKAKDLSLLELETKGGNTADTKKMTDARKILEEEMRKLGMYIYITADGNVTKMLTTLFPLTSDSVASAKRPLLKLKRGEESGEIIASCKAMSKAVAYVWMYYVGENEPENYDDWKFGEATTKVKKTFMDLVPRTKLWVRVSGVTSEGMTPWINAVNIIVT